MFFVVLQFSDFSFPIPNPAYLFICEPGRQNKTLRRRVTVVYIYGIGSCFMSNLNIIPLTGNRLKSVVKMKKILPER